MFATKVRRLSGVVAYVALLLGAALAAVQAGAAGTLTVTNTQDSGPGSLRQAIADATSGDTITFDLPAGSTIVLTSGPLVIAKHLSIIGPDYASVAATQGAQDPSTLTVTIDGSGQLRLLEVSAVDLFLARLNLTGGNANGAALAPGFGGAIYLAGGALDGDALTIANNTAANSGGGIYNNGGTLLLNNSELRGNSISHSQSHGGAIANVGVSGFPAGTSLTRTQVISNTGGFVGGGLSNLAQGADATLQLSGVVCARNSAVEGGCLFNAQVGTPGSASAAVDGASIFGNTAETGAGLANVNGVLHVYDAILYENISDKTGAAVASGGDTTIDFSVVYSHSNVLSPTNPIIYIASGAPPVAVSGSILANDVNCAGSNTILNAGYNLINAAGCFPDGQNNSQVQAGLPGWLSVAAREDGGPGAPPEAAAYLHVPGYEEFIPGGAIPTGPALQTDYRGVARPQGQGATPGPFESAGQIVVTKQVIAGPVDEGLFTISLLEQGVNPAFEPIVHQVSVKGGDTHVFQLTRPAGPGTAAVTLREEGPNLDEYDVQIVCDNGASAQGSEINLQVDPQLTVACTITNIRKIGPGIYLPIVLK